MLGDLPVAFVPVALDSRLEEIGRRGFADAEVKGLGPGIVDEAVAGVDKGWRCGHVGQRVPAGDGLLESDENARRVDVQRRLECLNGNG